MARCSFIQLNELGHRGENGNAQASKQNQGGFGPGVTQLRVRGHSNAELPRYTSVNAVKIQTLCKKGITSRGVAK